MVWNINGAFHWAISLFLSVLQTGLIKSLLEALERGRILRMCWCERFHRTQANHFWFAIIPQQEPPRCMLLGWQTQILNTSNTLGLCKGAGCRYFPSSALQWVRRMNLCARTAYNNPNSGNRYTWVCIFGYPEFLCFSYSLFYFKHRYTPMQLSLITHNLKTYTILSSWIIR